MSKSAEEHVTYFAATDARNKRVRFGIKAKDRTRHVYVIGKTGMGKSVLLENMAVQDIQNGNGFAFIDPHGKTAELLLDYIPEHRKEDVLYFAPFDMEYPIAFNIMEDVGADKRHLVLSGLMSTFKKIWVDAWSARMEYILSNTILALLEYPGATLLSVNKMYSDKDFRKKVVDNIQDMSVKSFWVDEYAKYTDRFTQEATPAIQNKIGQFTSNPVIRNIIGQQHSTFDLRKIMDEKKIIILNLSKGRVGEVNANLLGSMFITKIYLAAMSRADVSDEVLSKLPNFYLYVDEFQSFANEAFADILSEARKYKLNLTIAHQYVEQMSEEVRAAVFGNVGTMITFRVGATDAEAFEKEFAPRFTAEDIVNLDKYQIYLRLMIDGVGSSPFSAATLPPIQTPEESLKNAVIESSRVQFARPRAEVEIKVASDLRGGVPEEKKDSKEAPKAHGLTIPVPPKEQKDSPMLGKPKYEKSEQRAVPKNDNRTQGTKPPQKNDQGVSLGKAIQEALVHTQTQKSSKKPTFEKVEQKPKVDAPPIDESDGFKPLTQAALKQQIFERKHVQQKTNEIPKVMQKKPQVVTKGATKEHLADLRSALSGVMKKSQNAEPQKIEQKKPSEAPKQMSDQVAHTTAQTPKKEQNSDAQNTNIQSRNEVPKSMLEHVLNGD